MKQFLREYGCMLFGHEDDDLAFCVHCDGRNPWIPPTQAELWILQMETAFRAFTQAMENVANVLLNAFTPRSTP